MHIINVHIFIHNLARYPGMVYFENYACCENGVHWTFHSSYMYEPAEREKVRGLTGERGMKECLGG